MSDLYFFNASGKEVAEGANDSVVQHTAGSAEAAGFKFKKRDETVAVFDAVEAMRLANLDGSEPDAPPSKPVTVAAFDTAEAQRLGNIDKPSKADVPTRTAKP